ncbi:MAG: single-stranded-DNA-specific exonuclease RecJ [Deltaproteobacteria bacterium]|nr:single-stranded-DNA-specific exonuclease RecJ [Deltaproteobacteria bacterium]
MIWKYRPINKTLALELATSLGQPYKYGEFLTARGFESPTEVSKFLTQDLSSLPSPETMPGLLKATELLLWARRENKIVAIAGDYDVDGLTATALLTRVLTAYGLKVISRVPNRLTEGYGLSSLAVSELVAKGAGLLVTVDCGVSDKEAVETANRAGLPVVITDHHQLPPVLPEAVSILNPHLGGGWEKDPLAGVGVAFILAWGLKMALKKEGLEFPNFSLVENLALVALGSIADLAPLKGPNRVLVQFGLNFLAKVNWAGLTALRKKALKNEEFISTRDVGFRLAPRLNAAGRLGQTEVALDILLEEDPDKATALAERLEALNRTRLSDQTKLLAEALDGLEEEDMVFGEKRTVVLAGPGWPKGLLGLVATRVVEATNRPTIILSIDGDMAVGSGRSVSGFNLFQALEPTRDLCLSMGGHAMAAGLKIHVDNLRDFKAAFEEAAARQVPLDREASLDVDFDLDLADLDIVGERLAQLEPFGHSNPNPVAVVKNVQVLEVAPTKSGGDKHLTVRLFDGSSKVKLIGFGLAPRIQEIGNRLDVAVTLDTERFGRREPNWRLLDFKRPTA